MLIALQAQDDRPTHQGIHAVCVIMNISRPSALQCICTTYAICHASESVTMTLDDGSKEFPDKGRVLPAP
jgi:hypothetical protein